MHDRPASADGSSRGMPTHVLLLLIATVLAGLCCGFDLGLFAFTRQQLPLAMGLDAGQIGLLAASANGGGLLASFGCGLIAEAWGRKRALILCAVLLVISLILLVLARDWTLFAAGRIVGGAYGCAIGIVLSLLLAECLPAHRRGMGAGILQIAVWGGLLIATAITANATQAMDANLRALPVGTAAANAAHVADQAWRHLTWQFFLPAGLLLAASLTAPQSPRWLYQKGRRHEAMAALRQLRGEAQARIEYDEMVAMEHVAEAESGAPRASLVTALTHPHFRKPLLLVLALSALQNANGFGAVLCFSADLLGAAGFDKVGANQAGIWMAAAICVGTAVSIPLMDRVGRRRLLLTGGLLVALSLLVMAVLFRLLENSSSPTPLTGRVACGALAIYGLGMGVGPCTCFWALVSELLPTRIRSMGMGVGVVILAVVTMVSQAVFLPLTQRLGYAAMIGAWLAGSILFVAFVQRFLPETKGKTLEEIEAGFADDAALQAKSW